VGVSARAGTEVMPSPRKLGSQVATLTNGIRLRQAYGATGFMRLTDSWDRSAARPITNHQSPFTSHL
jgi:hypothetical protein